MVFINFWTLKRVTGTVLGKVQFYVSEPCDRLPFFIVEFSPVADLEWTFKYRI
jgi:hypothetical protein